MRFNPPKHFDSHPEDDKNRFYLKFPDLHILDILMSKRVGGTN